MQAGRISTLLLAAALCAGIAQTPSLAKQSQAKDRASGTTAAATALMITVDEAATSKTLKQGDTATVAVKTTPSAQGTITVKLKSGLSKNASLVPQKAGADGVLKWSWTVAKNTAPGPIAWTVSVQDKKHAAQSGGTIVVEAAAGADTDKAKSVAPAKSGKAKRLGS